jgi:hypothetical protein
VRSHREIVGAHPEAIRVFAAFLPNMGLRDGFHLTAALLFFLKDDNTAGFGGELSGEIGTYLMQIVRVILDRQHLGDATRLFKAFSRLISICPRIASSQLLAEFYDSIVNQIMAAFSPLLLIVSNEFPFFQIELADFVHHALRNQWLSDKTLVIEWLDQLIGTGTVQPVHLQLLEYLPVESMPVVRSWLASLAPSDNERFNAAVVRLMGHFAKRAQFGHFFDASLLLQLIERDCDCITEAGIDVLIDLVQSRQLAAPDFVTMVFRFLFSHGFHRNQFIQYKVVEALSMIARLSEKPDELWEVAMTDCPFQNDVLGRFLAVVIRRDLVVNRQEAIDQFYKFFLTHGRTIARFD